MRNIKNDSVSLVFDVLIDDHGQIYSGDFTVTGNNTKLIPALSQMFQALPEFKKNMQLAEAL
jgi:hypothetical protein